MLSPLLYLSILFLLCMSALTPLSANPYQVGKVNIINDSIMNLQQAMQRGNLSSEDLVKRYLARIDAYDQKGPELNAIIRLNPNALRRAIELDEERREKGPRSLLHGIPVILKDNFNTYDLPTSGGSVALAGFMPKEDAFQVKKLRQAGAIILAKANMQELASGEVTVSALGGSTKNPYDISRVPGGSSGGSAVAVAAGYSPISMGTDTCGSITIPAAYNNLVGIRPSKGLSSIAGIIPLIPTLDVAAPMARSMQDLAIVMDIVAGFDADDIATHAVSDRKSPGFVSTLDSIDLSDLRLGKLTSLFGSGTYEAETTVVINRALDGISQYGVKIIDLHIPEFEELSSQIVARSMVEFRPQFDKFLKTHSTSNRKISSEIIKEHGAYSNYFGLFQLDSNPETQEINKLAAKALRKKAQHLITKIMKDNNIDALIYPGAKQIPVKIGEIQGGPCASLSALSGLPSLTLPAGFTTSGLPVGMQLLGHSFSDERLVAIGYAIEQKLKIKRSPTVTPILDNGKAPVAVSFSIKIDNKAEVDFTFDVTKSELAYKTILSQEKEAYAVCLHQSKQGPIIQCLSGINGRRLEGRVQLNYENVKRLREGELHVRAYSQENPLGSKGTVLVLPLVITES